VVMEFSPHRLDLTEVERSKLIKIAGARYNPSTRIIKIACESFETPAQNKRYLGDLVEVLIKEAKDATDTFEDLPFDFRHHRPKPVHVFPEEWKLTPEKRAELLATRQARLEAERLREVDDAVVDGLTLIPGGTEMRDRELWVESMKEEQKVLALHDEEKLERPLEEEKLQRLRERESAFRQMEKVELKIDSTARRSSKRAKYLQRFAPKDDSEQANSWDSRL
jgi:Mitochondrial ribosomal subunit protein